MNLLNNRKGFVGDLVFVLIMLSIMGLFIFIGFTLFDAVNNDFQSNDNLSPEGKAIVSENQSRYVALWDGIFLMVFVMYMIALVLSVSALGSRPEFFFVIVFIGLLLVGLGAILGNIFTEFVTAFPAAGAAFTYIPLFYEFMAEIVLGMIALFLLGLFAKARGTI